MSQLNIHMTPALESALNRFMKARGIATQSEAVRTAVEEALSKAEPSVPPQINLDQLMGIAAGHPQTPRETWVTEDELWGDDGR